MARRGGVPPSAGKYRFVGQDEYTVFRLKDRAALAETRAWLTRHWGWNPGTNVFPALQHRRYIGGRYVEFTSRAQFIYPVGGGKWRDAETGAVTDSMGEPPSPRRTVRREEERRTRRAEQREDEYLQGYGRSQRTYREEHRHQRITRQAGRPRKRTTTVRAAPAAKSSAEWDESQHPRRRDGTFRRK